MIKEAEKSKGRYPYETIENTSAKSYPKALNIILGSSCALLMLQLYLIAPLVPGFESEFRSGQMGLGIPVFAIPFALAAAGMTLFPSSIKKPDRWFSFSLIALSAGSVMLSRAESAESFLINRLLTGLSTGTMLPAALIMATRTVLPKRSLINMAVIIFFLAAGMTFGPSLGGWLNGLWGWRSLFLVIGALAALLWLSHILLCRTDHSGHYRQQRNVTNILPTQILRDGLRSYVFVFLSGVFHSGIFVWIINYFSTRYHLDEWSLGSSLLIFGLPGLSLTFLMFRYHLDSKVLKILDFGLLLTVTGLLIMMADVPLYVAELLLVVMSVGFCFSQPLFIGILKLPIGGVAAGRLMALGSGVLFFGYGCGPLIMSALLKERSLATGFLLLLVIVLAVLSRRVWHISELHTRHRILHGSEEENPPLQIIKTK